MAALERGSRRIAIVVSAGALSVLLLWIGWIWYSGYDPMSSYRCNSNFCGTALILMSFITLLVFVPWIAFYLVRWIVRGFTGS
jgi:hypothetical protein